MFCLIRYSLFSHCGVLCLFNVLLCIALCPFRFCNHLDRVREPLFLVVPWVGLRCLIVVFPNQTPSLFMLHTF